MAKTITTWEGEQPDPGFRATVEAQVAIYVTEGKTDGQTSFSHPIPNQRQVERTWLDVASAQAFLDFLDTLTPKALTKEIIE
jgi:hypothetical protein